MLYEGQLLLDEMIVPAAGKTENRVIDLKRIVPVGKIIVEGGAAVSLSLDGDGYAALPATDGAGGKTARYIRLDAQMPAHVRVYVGRGYIAEAEPYWTSCFARYGGWAGADGIFTFNLTDGCELPGSADGGRSLFFFGDTLVSEVDPKTLARSKDVTMPNNTFALLTGEDPKTPGALEFVVGQDAAGKPKAVLVPERGCFDFSKTSVPFEQTYYWLQDGFVYRDKLYVLPSLIAPDETRPEGFQFQTLGISIVEADIADGRPDFARARQMPSGLRYVNGDVSMHYGYAIMPWLSEAGYKNGDGYVYVYGGMTGLGAKRSLCVARVRPDRFTEEDAWSFYDGNSFQPDISKSAQLLEHVSCEMSVTPIPHGANKGRFLAVFQYDTQSHYTAYAVGETPWGPFSEAQPVFYCSEHRTGKGMYAYNAKAHPHLSPDGALLASYNVNTTSFDEHMENGHIYRPRFMLLRDTSLNSWDALFGDEFRRRTEVFRALAPMAEPGGTVFLGDSITQEYRLEEMLAACAPVYNRGIGGDTTAGALTRMEESAYALHPSKVFLFLGTNDLALLPDSEEEVAARMGDMIDGIKMHCPACAVYVISALPVNHSGHPKAAPTVSENRSNERIAKLNALYADLCTRKNACYVDAASSLKDESGQLAIRYTRDGLHLSSEGYKVLTKVLMAFLA